MGLWKLFIAALMPVLKVLILTAVGSFIAFDRVGIMGPEARKHLNNVCFYVFNPALVGASLAESITYKSIVMLWFMPFNILITYVLGSALGWILIKVIRTPSDLQGLVLGCCAAGNLGNMLLIIIPAICKEKGSPFGDADICHTTGMAYASLSMAIGAIYLWSYVYNLIRMYSKGEPEGAKLNDSKLNENSVGETSGILPESSTPQILPLNGSSISDNRLEQLELQCTTPEDKAKVPNSVKIKQQLQAFAIKMNVKALFSPTIVGAIIGFIFGLVPPFQKSIIGDSAPLRVLQESATTLGDAAIPSITLIMGANLVKGLKSSRIRVPILVGIIIVRYIALPMLGIVIVKGFIRAGLVNSDPLYQFVLLLQYALPPAVNIATMTQLFGAGESECSIIMLSTYVLATVALTLWSTVFMWLVK